MCPAAGARIVARMATFTGYLRARSDEELVALLVRRPDLATPHPATLGSLAARATSRSSLDRALTWVDALVLQVVEAVVVLDAGAGVPRRRVADAVGAGPQDATEVDRAVDDAVALALLWPDGDGALHPAPGLADAVGTSHAGLAPGGDLPALDPSALRRELDDAPPGASAVLDALTWGPPLGRLPAGGTARAAVDWLIGRGLLERSDGRHVLLPRQVALALRDGRTHRAPAVRPAPGDGPRRAAEVVAAESAGAAEQTVRLVRLLAQRWSASPPPVLRGGGLGARDLRRTAQGLDVDEPQAAWLVETAAAAGLLADDGEESPRFVATLEHDVWSAQDLPTRWTVLARAWLTSARAPWLVGTRDERGALRAALDPELARPWVPRLRRAVLDVLAAAPAGTALTAQQVHDALTWRSPRSAPPREAVDALLTEADHLGVRGAGALTAAGRALLEDGDAAAALAADLPAPVDEILLQGDLTGVVPGRPGEDLEDLLELAAQVESRGGAVTVRFTPESVLRALDAGTTADDLLARLTTAARGRVPQALDYLVRDVARRHGRVRVGAASAYVRADDPVLLAGLVEDPQLARLRPRLLAPTVLVADATPAELLAALRQRGAAPVAEDAHGVVLHAGPTEHRVRARSRRSAPVHERPPAERAVAVVATLRRSDADPAPAPREDPAGSAPPRPAGGTSEPGDVLVVLREAVQSRASVWVDIVGADGRGERRLVRPLRVEGGRLRALDRRREAEITVAVHRIAGVTPDGTTS